MPYADRYQIAWLGILAACPDGGVGTASYLYICAHGAILDAARQGARREAGIFLIPLADRSSPDPHPRTSTPDLSPRTAAALQTLPEREAWLVRQVILEGRMLTDVAHEIGLSESWAGTLLARALRKLARPLRSDVPRP